MEEDKESQIQTNNCEGHRQKETPEHEEPSGRPKAGEKRERGSGGSGRRKRRRRRNRGKRREGGRKGPR